MELGLFLSHFILEGFVSIVFFLILLAFMYRGFMFCPATFGLDISTKPLEIVRKYSKKITKYKKQRSLAKPVGYKCNYLGESLSLVIEDTRLYTNGK